MIVLYEFRDRLPTLRRVRRVVVHGDRAEIERFIPLSDFGRLFGGFLLWRGDPETTGDAAGDAVGVWGTRTIRRFKRTLRERGARYRCVRDVDPGRELVALHVDPGGPAGAPPRVDAASPVPSMPPA